MEDFEDAYTYFVVFKMKELHFQSFNYILTPTDRIYNVYSFLIDLSYII